MSKYLDEDGLRYLWVKIQDEIRKEIDKSSFEIINLNISNSYGGRVTTTVTVTVDGVPTEYLYDNIPLTIRILHGKKYVINISELNGHELTFSNQNVEHIAEAGIINNIYAKYSAYPVTVNFSGLPDNNSGWVNVTGYCTSYKNVRNGDVIYVPMSTPITFHSSQVDKIYLLREVVRSFDAASSITLVYEESEYIVSLVYDNNYQATLDQIYNISTDRWSGILIESNLNLFKPFVVSLTEKTSTIYNWRGGAAPNFEIPEITVNEMGDVKAEYIPTLGGYGYNPDALDFALGDFDGFTNTKHISNYFYDYEFAGGENSFGGYDEPSYGSPAIDYVQLELAFDRAPGECYNFSIPSCGQLQIIKEKLSDINNILSIGGFEQISGNYFSSNGAYGMIGAAGAYVDGWGLFSINMNSNSSNIYKYWNLDNPNRKTRKIRGVRYFNIDDIREFESTYVENDVILFGCTIQPFNSAVVNKKGYGLFLYGTFENWYANVPSWRNVLNITRVGSEYFYDGEYKIGSNNDIIPINRVLTFTQLPT